MSVVAVVAVVTVVAFDVAGTVLLFTAALLLLILLLLLPLFLIIKSVDPTLWSKKQKTKHANQKKC